MAFRNQSDPEMLRRLNATVAKQKQANKNTATTSNKATSRTTRSAPLPSTKSDPDMLKRLNATVAQKKAETKPADTTKLTDFNTRARDAYTSARDKVLPTTSRSKAEIKTRIRQIDTELANLNNVRRGAGLYGYVGDKTVSNDARQAELLREKQALKNELESSVVKTTITSDLSDDERKKRIGEIESEIQSLNSQLHGLGRAEAYGTSKTLKAKKEETANRIAELNEELKTLERVGSFTAAELKQFEIDDAKARKNALPNYNPTARVAPSSVDAFKKNVSEHFALDSEIDSLEREKELYENIANNTLIIFSQGTSRCMDGDKFDSLLGERLAEARAKYVIYKFFYEHKK
jgi:hypothetical protein